MTQNTDGLHRQAGSQRLIDLHGQLYKTRCAHCDREAFDDLEGYDDERPEQRTMKTTLLAPVGGLR